MITRNGLNRCLLNPSSHQIQPSKSKESLNLSNQNIPNHHQPRQPMKTPNPIKTLLFSTILATLVAGSGRADTYTYTRGGAGETTGFLPGMSIDQSNFAGGTFGTTGTTYPAVNFDNYKAGTEGVQLIFSPIPEPWRFDIPQGVNACYGIKWAAPSGQVFTSVNFELFNSCNEFPFEGSAYAVIGGIPTLLGSWGNGGVTPATGGSFSFATEQNVTEIRVYALDARLGTTGNNQPYPNVFRAWNGQTLGISSIQVDTAAAPLPRTFTYTRGGAGETTGFLPGMSIDQSNFAGGEFGTTNTTYPAVNFDNYKAGTEGVQLIFSPIPDPYRFDVPQGVDACYGIKWAAPSDQVFTSVNFSLFNYGANDMPFKGSAYAVSGGVPTLLGSWGDGGVTPGTGGSFSFSRGQNVTEIRVYALDARLGTTGNEWSYPNVFRAWNGDGVGITSVQVTLDAVLNYGSWAATNAGGQAANLDWDNDGVTNGVEFFMNAAPGFTANPGLDGSKKVTWTNGGNIPFTGYGTQFVVQVSTDLVTWDDVTEGDMDQNGTNTASSLSYTLDPANNPAKQFVRLKVTP
jgi:hypothetical protein